MTAALNYTLIDIEQGSPEWLALRKTKITATDSCAIMGASHWKTKLQLYHEKLSNDPPAPRNERMQRGIDLEPIARSLFALQLGVSVEPKVVVKDWAMASLDGINELGTLVVEIKCPGEKDHAVALSGKVPDHYYPQLQHQMYVCDVEEMYYFSFDGVDGVAVKVKRNHEYIAKMVVEELKFYECLLNQTPPEPGENDYIQRDDALWEKCASEWRSISAQIKELESIEEDLRKQIIFLSGESNSKGAGISLCQVNRKGNVQYSKIECLKNIDLDQYRGETIKSWRLTCNT